MRLGPTLKALDDCQKGPSTCALEESKKERVSGTYPSNALFLRMRGRGEELPWLGDIVKPGELATPTPGPCDNDPVT